MPKEKDRQPEQLTKELYLFTIFNLLGGSVYGLYYGIFLYRHSFNIEVLAIDSLLVALSGWAGYILGTFWIHRQGYLKAMRTTFLLLFITAVVTLLLINHIRQVYPLLSVMRGLPGGMYGSIIDIYLLKEMSGVRRGRYLNLNLSAEFAIAVIIPVVVGGLITAHGYRLVFLLAAAIYLSTFLLPVRYNKRPKSNVSLDDELEIMKLPGIKEYNVNTVLTYGADQLNILLIAIVPFLIFGSELKVGMFSSLIAILAAVMSIAFRDISFRRQVRLGYLGNLGRLISNIILSVMWTPAAQFLQGIVNKAMSPLNDPIFHRLRIENAASILGDEVAPKALEMDLLNATMSLIGQVLALSLFLIILALDGGGQIAALKYLLVLYGIWKIINYIWVLNMRQRLIPAPKGEKTYIQPRV